jgi:hypothetical protein
LKLPFIIKRYHIKAYKQFLKTIGTTSDKTSRNLFRLFQFAIYAILLVFFINIFSFGKSGFGEWGDFFGGVLNPILTFLTFMGLLITIVLQQKELRESKNEFKKSADALLDQSDSFRKQNFESTFFKLIEKFEEQSVHLIRIYIDDKTVKQYVTSRDIRHFGFEYLRYDIYKHKEYYKKDGSECNSKEAYEGLSKQGTTKILLEDYFKNFKFLISFIENSNLIDKGMYYKIFFSDLTNGEQILLFYHILYEDTSNSIKPIVEKYSLFEYIGWKGLTDSCLDLIKYNMTAYGNNTSIVMMYEHCLKEVKSYNRTLERNVL